MRSDRRGPSFHLPSLTVASLAFDATLRLPLLFLLACLLLFWGLLLAFLLFCRSFDLSVINTLTSITSVTVCISIIIRTCDFFLPAARSSSSSFSLSLSLSLLPYPFKCLDKLRSPALSFSIPCWRLKSVYFDHTSDYRRNSVFLLTFLLSCPSQTRPCFTHKHTPDIHTQLWRQFSKHRNGNTQKISAPLPAPLPTPRPYIEGKRTVPETMCYIQFLETNLYITFGTALAAFYIPVSVSISLSTMPAVWLFLFFLRLIPAFAFVCDSLPFMSLSSPINPLPKSSLINLFLPSYLPLALAACLPRSLCLPVSAVGPCIKRSNSRKEKMRMRMAACCC